MASKVSSDFDKKGIQELYQQLMSMSRKLQYQQLVKAGALGRLPFIEIDSLGVEKARVVFQGMEGAYGQAAMKTYFGEDCNSYSVRTFRDAMEAIEEGAADYAVLPIENSTAGAVNEVYDLPCTTESERVSFPPCSTTIRTLLKISIFVSVSEQPFGIYRVCGMLPAFT